MSELLKAVKAKKVAVVARHVRSGAPLNVMDDQTGESLLALAASTGSLPIVRLLLEAGADPNFPETVAWPLANAAGRGHSEIVDLLLDYDAETEAIDEDFTTALASAAAGGHIEVVELLVEAGANAKQNCGGRRPIHFAAQNGHSEVVDYLAPLSKKPDVEEAATLLKEHSRGPISEEVEEFHTAALKGELIRLQSYLDAGMDPDSPDECGTTAAGRAATGGQVDVLKLLAASGADLTIIDDIGRCPLLYAAWGGQEAAYNYLYDMTPAKYQKEAEEVRRERTAEGFWKPAPPVEPDRSSQDFDR